MSLPYTYEVKHEQITRVALSLVKATRKGTKVKLVLLRTVPIVEKPRRVGTVTEQATITLVLQSSFERVARVAAAKPA